MVEQHTKTQVVKVVQEEDRKENNEEDEQEDEQESGGWAVFKADGVEFQIDLKQRVERERKDNNAEDDAEKEDEDDDDDDAERYYIGESGLLDRGRKLI